MSKRTLIALLLASILIGTLLVSASLSASTFPLTYRVSFEPETNHAIVEMRLGDHQGDVVEFDFEMPESRYEDVRGDGSVERKGRRVLWHPPKNGGSFHYRHVVNHRRGRGGFDAFMTKRWIIARGDDLFPAATLNTAGRERSITELQVVLPKKWHVVTPFPRIDTSDDDSVHHFSVKRLDRRFDRPVGWFIAGRIGSRWDWIDGTSVGVAAPMGAGFRRLDVMAFLSYNLPEMANAFGALPKRLIIVGAPEPMWRGGLSAPNSFFLHVDRPLISENGTSPLLHELTHSITGITGQPGADWIVEGTAEFYSLELQRRSGGMSSSRFRRAIRWQAEWGKHVDSLISNRSRAEITARAVVLLHALNREIRAATGNKRSLDDVMQQLIPIGKISTDQFVSIVESVMGGKSKVLDTPLLKPIAEPAERAG